ncbi:TetR family transcriptional regulator [Galactobacter valiniphilus]|uniref:TetR family transcriptional regulator n=1 Tax=Galactobacter valiniphilus TaxID=2676122 RepID=A0A399JAK5_9MICC|nr:TetR/AcrR family transcriptional regulator C-terminal domain-containing protein [Galactobacter valiniphilus]RII42090.1 TetR family transcriptional regulator [Galactobacter valiniphilus]
MSSSPAPSPASSSTANRQGARTRALIRAAASALALTRTPGQFTVKHVAEAAGVFPNQITHHFGSKDRLYLEAAFALLLRDSGRLTRVARGARSPEEFGRALARTALALPSLPSLTSALALARGHEELGQLASGYLKVLFARSERFLERRLQREGWAAGHGVARASKTFWVAVFGAVLAHEAGFAGGPTDLDIASGLALTRGSGSATMGS